MTEQATPGVAQPTDALLTNRLYDFLKWVALILLPALGTLYAALAALWGLPNPAEVVGSIVAVDAFLGALLQLSAKGYSPQTQGVVTLSEAEETGLTDVRVQMPNASRLIGQDHVVLEVRNHLRE